MTEEMNEIGAAAEPLVKVLLKAADIVESGWTRNANAKDRLGKPCDATSDKAVRWCGEGALLAALGDTSNPSWVIATNLRGCLARHVKAGSFHYWNDYRARSGKHVARVMRELAAQLLTPSAPTTPPTTKTGISDAS